MDAKSDAADNQKEVREIDARIRRTVVSIERTRAKAESLAIELADLKRQRTQVLNRRFPDEMPLSETPLSQLAYIRAARAVARHFNIAWDVDPPFVATVGHVRKMREIDFFKQENLGKKTVKEIKSLISLKPS